VLVFLFTFWQGDIIIHHDMNLHRFYCELINRPVAELSGTEARHLAQVLRLKAGDKVELFDGKGTLAAATIKNASGKKVALQVEDVKVFPKPDAQIILAVSVAKGERFDWLVEKCTELGVDRMVPVLFERTVKQPKNPKIVERWNNIAIAAAKQCRRVFLPQIDRPLTLLEAVEILKKDYPQGTLLFGSLSENSKPVLQCGFAGKNIIAFVGPEGGLTDEEENLLRENGAGEVRLTDTVLRVETAAVTFAAVLTIQRDAQSL
jgi:16S rRNA (uracil1498-N3)-methyltransferase